MTQILVTKPGQLTRADKLKLRRADIVTVEADRPEDVRLIGAEGPPMGGGDLLYAAIHAMALTPDDSANRYTKARFVQILAKLLEEQRSESEGSDAP